VDWLKKDDNPKQQQLYDQRIGDYFLNGFNSILKGAKEGPTAKALKKSLKQTIIVPS